MLSPIAAFSLQISARMVNSEVSPAATADFEAETSVPFSSTRPVNNGGTPQKGRQMPDPSVSENSEKAENSAGAYLSA